ncbi:MAG: chromosome segregation protein [Deltaproteobacteria bacterium]|nr:chromosome segregation protein [Deltaproteobacteria bacterium]
MRIKRVEIIGFKSFCDRAVVQIGESITGVVGPNGCGKSNIVDAIRWCMGEQSAKHLRGKAMEDVIFGGSESRGPAPMAEVSLTFDDVGFSHETLEMARHSDEASTEQALEGLVPEGADDDVADVDAGDGLDAADAADAAADAALAAAPAAPAGTWVDADGNSIASPTEEVAQLLEDQPPAFDFAHYTEVTITRRLYRDGVSQYFINKSACRLRDITDFFLGTGVGTKAYAIIEQGRIGQIVSSRPQDRRAIIEEAAGITKFKAKKKAAERKLDQTRQNLMRVSDIVAELDKRMGTLRRQAQKAERYRKYKSEVKDIELWKAAHRWLELAGESQLVGGRFGEARVELDDARGAWTIKDAHLITERAELAVEERRLVGLQEQVYELENRIRLGDSKIGFERREAEDLEIRITGAQSEIAEIASQRERGAAELAARTGELEALEADVERESAEVATREAATGEAKQMLANAQGMLDEARIELATRRTEIATSEAQLDALARRRDEASRRLERVVNETDQHTARVKELEREGRRVDSALSELRQTRFDLGSQSEGFETRREVLAHEVARGESEVETLRTELHRRKSRLVSLEEIQERYEGFARGTRAVMQQADAISDTDSIRGVVADVVRAPESLEVAVEAALGDRLGGVLVSEPEVGLAAIGFLKQGGGGRSAFVPMAVPTRPSRAARADAHPGAPSEVGQPVEGEGGAASWRSPASDPAGGPSGEHRGTAIDFEDRTQLVAAMAAVREEQGYVAGVGGEGVLGRMADLVSFADGYEQVGKRLLGGTVVVEDLRRALDLYGRGVSDRLVTLDGDIVDEDGVVAGGSRDAQGSGVLAQKREIRDLHEIVGRLEHDLSEATTRLVTARTELTQVLKAIEGLKTQVHEGEIAIMGHEKDETRVRTDLERLRDRLGQLGTEQLELEERLQAIGSDESVNRERRSHAEQRIGELERVQLELLSEVTTHRDRLEELAQILTEVRIRAAQLTAQRSAAEAATLRLQRTDGELASRTERLVTEIEDAARRVANLREGCDQLGVELASVREERDEGARLLEEGRGVYQTRWNALTEVELAARELRSRTDRLATEVGQLELRNGQISMTRKVVEDHIGERYQLEVRAILHEYHLRAMITDVEEGRLTELRELIERMGTDINLTAIEEYAEVSQRFEFLSAQRNDLDRAVDQLQRAIDKINRTSRKLFKDTFNAVNATFKEVFPRLFRGGQAALSLAGGDDVDLLEAGVDIMAQPPGKKNSTVEQLSGGEKALTAVALVFSIFLIKPSPFCILDEVDAPLDEANVDRYNELVREMTDRSQFIVITHNKRTMESADNLYGVTMQEPGVSKLVSVNLNKLGRSVGAGTASRPTAGVVAS